MSSEDCSCFLFVRFDYSVVEEYCCNGGGCDSTTLSDDKFNCENFCTIRLPWGFVLLLSFSITGVALNKIRFSINTMVTVSFTGILLNSLYPKAFSTDTGYGCFCEL